MVKDELGMRMKEYYENIPKTRLTRRVPVIARIDGKAFHTFTRNFSKPFDEILMWSMWDTAKYLCENVQNCKLAYTQSDEISLLLIDYEKPNSSAFFDYQVQKMTSIMASMATLSFNMAFRTHLQEFVERGEYAEDYNKRLDAYYKALKTGALFDARVFNIPKEEVCNYFIWREIDAVRNSVQMVGQSKFTQRQLNKKGQAAIKDMLLGEGIDWDSLEGYKKRGVCVNKVSFEVDAKIPDKMIKDQTPVKTVTRHRWEVDTEIPNFTDDKEYIEKHVFL